MKTITVLATILACASGCSKEKKEPTTPTPPSTAGPTAKQPARPAPDIQADQPVSPGLAVSPDIAAACGQLAGRVRDRQRVRLGDRVIGASSS